MKKLFLVFALTVLFPVLAAAQGTGFNFQGRMNDGTNPANGSYDLQFRLYDAIMGGTPIGALAARPNTTLINGVFSVTLDFGVTAFNSPDSVFIEIGVRPNGSPNAYTILGPRQQLTVVPFAVRARNSTFADLATNATNATNAQSAINAQNALTLITIPGAEFVTKTNGGADFIRNSTASQPTSNFNISGNGNVGNNLSVAGNVLLEGDIRQISNSGGAVKAMAVITVTRTGFPNPTTATAVVSRCFSGVALPSAPNCGITIGTVSLSDRVQINFGFTVNNRFVSLTGVNDTVSFQSYPNATTVEVDDTTTNGGSSQFFIYVY
ncbi:MAG: hypothetical protein LH472_04455 [Pyrinomonadaceae bacterium]|nr:hypothetical protein [Pyrinomonadaceae bacterium]